MRLYLPHTAWYCSDPPLKCVDQIAGSITPCNRRFQAPSPVLMKVHFRAAVCVRRIEPFGSVEGNRWLAPYVLLKLKVHFPIASDVKVLILLFLVLKNNSLVGRTDLLFKFYPQHWMHVGGSRPFKPLVKKPQVACRKRGWIGPRAAVDVSGKRNPLPLPRIETRFLGSAATIPVTVQAAGRTYEFSRYTNTDIEHLSHSLWNILRIF